MTIFDILILIVAVAYALSGFLQGFVTGLAATIGLLAGGGIAVLLTPVILDGRIPTSTTALWVLGGVLLAALVGQAIGTHFGTSVRDNVTWRPARWLDSMAGGALGVVAVLVASWAMGYAVSGSQIPVLSQAVRKSVVLAQVDQIMPDVADDALSAFNRVIDTNLFPRYLEPFEPEKITEIEPPDASVLAQPEVKAARSSVVKILGASVCNRGIEGSGFAYAPGRVMTNAHVVAGVSRPFVIKGDRRVPARVVVYDPRIDVAVLAVDGLNLKPLEFDLTGSAGDSAVVLGYPENGPFDARPARIRQIKNLRSPNIYDQGQVVREAFAIRSLVRSGNSGGPLVSPAGDVYGVIFAASVSDSSTGYALTAKQVQADAAKGRSADDRVDTGGCA